MTSGDSVPEPVALASVIPLLPVWRVDRVFDYLVPESLSGRVTVGSLVRVPFGHRKIRGVVVAVSSEPASRELESIAAVVVDVPLAPPPLEQLLEWVARRYAVARGVAFSRIVPPRVRVSIPAIQPLRSVPSEMAPALLARYDGGESLLQAITGREPGVWSLRALPTDDRGELINALVEAAARGSGAALVSVPEVRYGSLVLDALQRARPMLARVDSAQSEGDRSRSWLALASGHGLGGGGRASVLAPVPDLGLIVVDEEHHHSYKEDRSPRYDARRVAVERARLQNAVCVFISSTPSLETGWRARSGIWSEASPGRELRRAARPIVEVVEPVEGRSITPTLHERVRDTLRSGRRVALLVGASGYARALWCASCKRSLRCPRCEAGLFYDRSGEQGPRVRCGRCGIVKGAPDTCPTCGASDWRYLGAGSERLTEQIARSFPRASVKRMDPDVLTRSGPAESQGDIYVTTWIGTKPALRPDVGLVGVLDADSLTRRPDFRAAESAYHALSEMAEWAGPASEGGRLVIQSSEPTHHALQAVVRADYSFWLDRELEERKELDYPPFAELVKVRAGGKDASALIERAAAIARGVGRKVLGPIEVRRQSSAQESSVELEILVKCDDATPVAEGLRELLASAAPGTLRVDVDPR